MDAPSTYLVHEVFDTIQGEGGRAGCRSVFLRMAGCNLWSGHPQDRDHGKGACARWCDTSFVGGTRMTALEIVDKLGALWPELVQRWVVISGGEPSLQVDEALVHSLNAAGWRVAMESNGTTDGPVLDLVDWLTVSPKLGAPLKRWRATELKVVLPGQVDGEGSGWTDEMLDGLDAVGHWGARWVQPQDPVAPSAVGVSHLHGGLEGSAAKYAENLTRCVEFVRRRPRWRLGLQQHKLLGLP